MKTIKTIGLTVFLIIGFTFQNCDPCDDCADILGSYFDIEGLELNHYRIKEGCCAEQLFEGDEVIFSDYGSLTIDYLVNYHSYNCEKANFLDFSLVNSAYACSCAQNGYRGSKEESLNSLIILTLNDFDEEHLANDTINDLLNVSLYTETVDLEEYVARDTSLIQYEQLNLELKQAPTLDDDLKLKVILSLSTGETYEAESASIVVIR